MTTSLEMLIVMNHYGLLPQNLIQAAGMLIIVTAVILLGLCIICRDDEPERS